MLDECTGTPAYTRATVYKNSLGIQPGVWNDSQKCHTVQLGHRTILLPLLCVLSTWMK